MRNSFVIMFKQSFNSFLATVKSISKVNVAFACVLLACVLAASIIVINENQTPATDDTAATQTSLQPSSPKKVTSDTLVHSHLSPSTVQAAQATIKANSSSQATNHPATSREGAATATQARAIRNETQTTIDTSNKDTSNTQTPANPSQPTTPQADYNLNDNWYFATVGVAGIVNSCWPTVLTIENEAACSDLTSPYYDFLFTGIGIAKTIEAAQTQAADLANQKAQAQHVDPRRGGGDPAILLTETLCTQNGLSCARW